MQEIRESIRISLNKLLEISQSETSQNEGRIQRIVKNLNTNNENLFCRNCIINLQNKKYYINDTSDLNIITDFPVNFNGVSTIQENSWFCNTKPYLKNKHYIYKINDIKFKANIKNKSFTIVNTSIKNRIYLTSDRICFMNSDFFVECYNNEFRVFHNGKIKIYSINSNEKLKSFNVATYTFSSQSNKLKIHQNDELLFYYSNILPNKFNYTFYGRISNIKHGKFSKLSITPIISTLYRINGNNYRFCFIKNKLSISNNVNGFRFKNTFYLKDKIYRPKFSILRIDQSIPIYKLIITKNILIVKFYTSGGNENFLSATLILGSDDKYHCKNFIVNNWQDLFLQLQLNIFNLSKQIL